MECEVSVGADPGGTHHRVAVRTADLASLAPPGTGAEELVRASFAFLLEREPRESILRTFEISIIGHYFPEYREEIRERLGMKSE